MKKLLTITILPLMMIFVIVGCDDSQPSDADTAQAEKTAQAMKDADAQVGMPAIVNWQEKKLAKMLYELRDQTELVCYYYFQDMEGRPIYQGKCIGYGLPYCVQFTNPERVAHHDKSYAGSFGTMPQPESNGLFMPETLSATWLMVINPETGEPSPAYIEPEILVSPFPLPYAVGHPEGLIN